MAGIGPVSLAFFLPHIVVSQTDTYWHLLCARHNTWRYLHYRSMYWDSVVALTHGRHFADTFCLHGGGLLS